MFPDLSDRYGRSLVATRSLATGMGFPPTAGWLGKIPRKLVIFVGPNHQTLDIAEDHLDSGWPHVPQSICTSASIHLRPGIPTIPMDSLNMSQPVVTPFLAFAQTSFFVQTMPKFRCSSIGVHFQESLAGMILGCSWLFLAASG